MSQSRVRPKNLSRSQPWMQHCVKIKEPIITMMAVRMIRAPRVLGKPSVMGAHGGLSLQLLPKVNQVRLSGTAYRFRWGLPRNTWWYHLLLPTTVHIISYPYLAESASRVRALTTHHLHTYLLIAGREDHHCLHVVVPHHPPEVLHRVRQRVLRDDELS